MKATIYTDPFNRKGLIAKDVKITKISEAPRFTKKGVMYKRPFASSATLTYELVTWLRLWKQGIRVAEVIYPDGTQDNNVWINVKDIVM